MYKKLSDVNFKTFASQKHPLALKKSAIPINEVLSETFLTTNATSYGLNSSLITSSDGWEDSKLKRENIITTSSLKCLESLLLEGLGISYLPEYYGKSLGLKVIKISNCPYNCNQKIIIARSKYSLDSIWSLI